MEWIYSILDSETAPLLTAFLLGLIMAISPCPLATNIAAIGFIGNDIEDRKKVFIKGVLEVDEKVVAKGPQSYDKVKSILTSIK